MKERPIIFSAEMVQAILDGRKTQTRRVVKEQPNRVRYNNIVMSGKYGWEDEHGRRLLNLYGAPGDRLWVRESFVTNYSDDIWVAYRADWDEAASEYVKPPKWKSPIHMPCWASRITLEITDIRVERLQDISESDADAEIFGGDFPSSVLPDMFYGNDYQLSLQECYARVWDSINAKRGYPWGSNPWVWVIEFKRLESDA